MCSCRPKSIRPKPYPEAIPSPRATLTQHGGCAEVGCTILTKHGGCASICFAFLLPPVGCARKRAPSLGHEFRLLVHIHLTPPYDRGRSFPLFFATISKFIHTIIKDRPNHFTSSPVCRSRFQWNPNRDDLVMRRNSQPSA